MRIIRFLMCDHLSVFTSCLSFSAKGFFDVIVYSASLLLSLNFLSLVWVGEEGSEGRGKESVICISAY